MLWLVNGNYRFRYRYRPTFRPIPIPTFRFRQYSRLSVSADILAESNAEISVQSKQKKLSKFSQKCFCRFKHCKIENKNWIEILINLDWKTVLINFSIWKATLSKFMELNFVAKLCCWQLLNCCIIFKFWYRFRYRFRYAVTFGIGFGSLSADTEIADISVSAEMLVSVVH